jgi:hypothetical protein
MRASWLVLNPMVGVLTRKGSREIWHRWESCQLDWIKRYTSRVPLRVFPEIIGIWDGSLGGKTCPEGEYHCPTGWEPRWNKNRRRRKPAHAKFFVPKQVYLLLLPPLVASDSNLLKLSIWTVTSNSPGSFQTFKLHWGCMICPPCSEASSFLDWATIHFSGSPACRQPLWNYLDSDHVSQLNKSLFIIIYSSIL